MKPSALVFALLLLVVTSDARAQWIQTAGPEGATVLASYAAANGSIFVGTLGGGIFRSTNAAASWEPVNAGLTDFNVYELHGDGNAIYAGTDRDGVFVSKDNGDSWTALMTGMTPGRATALLAADNIILYATMDQQFFRSTDAGQTWTVPPSAPASVVVDALVNFDGVIHAGDAGGMLHGSTDNGASWTMTNPGPGSAIRCIVRSANGDVVMGTIGGLLVSRDAMQTWVPMNDGIPFTQIQSLFVDDQNDLYTGTSSLGVYRWNASASEWEPAIANIHPDWVFGFCDLPGADFLALLAGQSLQKWNAGASTWTLAVQGLKATRLYHIAKDSAGRIYTSGASGYAYRSNDDGNSWQRVFGGMTRTSVNAVIPISETTLVVGTQGAGVYHSTDGGVSWVLRNQGLANTQVFGMHRSGSGALFAATWEGLFVSRDETNTWIVADARAPHFTLSVSGMGTHILAAMDSGRLLLSADDGATWRQVTLPTTANVVLAERMPWGDLLAAVENTGLFVSTDEGASWNLLTAQFASAYPGDLLFAAGKLYYASYGAGVWRSTDRGATWTEMNDGLLVKRISMLLRSRDGYLYAGSQGFGMFRSATQIVGVPDVAPATDGLTLRGNWPQPFTSEGHIRFNLEKPAEVSLVVLDATGRRILERRATKHAGEQSVSIDAARLTPGIYHYILAAHGASEAGRFIVVR